MLDGSRAARCGCCRGGNRIIVSPSLDRLAAASHGTGAIAWSVVSAAAGVALGGHILGRLYNRAKGNQFEERFHATGIAVTIVIITFGVFAIGVDSLAAASHARDARDD